MIRDGFAPQDAWTASSMVVDHAFTSTQKEERYRTLETENGPGGYRVLQLTDEDLKDLPHLKRALATQAPVTESPDFDKNYQRQLDCIITGIEGLFASQSTICS